MDPLPPLWNNRKAAGQALAQRFQAWDKPSAQTLLLALPRGGVPVAAAMAEALGWPLATWSVRKVADPSWPELALGAIAAGGVVVWRNGGQSGARDRERQARSCGWLGEEERELVRRQALFGDPDPRMLRQRHLVVVDDGIATGMTVRAALLSLRRCEPASLCLAVPVVDGEVARDLLPLVDRLEALAVVADLRAVGLWYAEFEQMSDQEVLALLPRG
ncbi:MAG: phosphoribosyltransferase [Cyanobacteria bacterium K_Offshore_surface_m2_239]|nr:phosphoribosyltransferase [Cyanobacteria bacterium K_Offshore_surface_m2_239]